MKDILLDHIKFDSCRAISIFYYLPECSVGWYVHSCGLNFNKKTLMVIPARLMTTTGRFLLFDKIVKII